MAKRNPTEYMRTMGVKMLCKHCGKPLSETGKMHVGKGAQYLYCTDAQTTKAEPATGAPAKRPEPGFNNFTQHFGMQQSVHEFASCPCEACAWLRQGKSAEQLEQMQRAALQASPVVKPNKE